MNRAKHQTKHSPSPLETTVLNINDIRQFMMNSRLRKILRPQRDKVRGNENKCMMKDSCFVLLTRYSPHDKVNEDEIGQSCSKYGIGKKYIQGFRRKT
jgi:hypothetical protein